MFALAPQNSLIWAPLVNACSTFCNSEWRFKAYLEDYLYTREDMRLDILSCSTLYLVAFSAKWKATQYSMSGKPNTGNWNWLFSHIEHHIRVTAGRSRGLTSVSVGSSPCSYSFTSATSFILQRRVSVTFYLICDAALVTGIAPKLPFSILIRHDF